LNLIKLTGIEPVQPIFQTSSGTYDFCNGAIQTAAHDPNYKFDRSDKKITLSEQLYYPGVVRLQRADLLAAADYLSICNQPD